jgi:hypothetical protein
MLEESLDRLPTRKELEIAIKGWWQGGGSTQLIVDVLRRTGTTLGEAQAVAERLAQRAEHSAFINAEVIEQHVESVRAGNVSRTRRVNGRRKDEDEFDSARCVFSDVLDCPQCSRIYGEPWKHGHLVSAEESAVFLKDAHEYIRTLFEEVAR